MNEFEEWLHTKLEHDFFMVWAHETHMNVWGVPCGPTLSMIRYPTFQDFVYANACPACDAYGICPSHKWIHDYVKRERDGAAKGLQSWV